MNRFEAFVQLSGAAANWASAGATAVAAGLALWFSVSDRRRTAAAERRRGELAAAATAPRLVAALRVLRVVRQDLGDNNGEGGDISSLRTALPQLDIGIGHDTLADLVYIESNVADHVAAGIGGLHQLRDLLRTVVEINPLSAMMALRGSRKMLISHCDAIETHLEAARAVCAAVGRVTFNPFQAIERERAARDSDDAHAHTPREP
jgi:hypothetical protein